MSYLCLDIGTSGCKAAVVNPPGETERSAERAYDLHFPEKGFVELDATEIWESVKSVLKELSGDSGEVTHIAVSGFGEAFVLLDREDRPLNRMIMYADSRCVGMDAELMRDFGGENMFEITGVFPNATYSLLRILWLKEHERRTFEAARSIFFAVDYFSYLLCGERGVDPGTASKTLLYDVHKKVWSDTILSRYHLPRELFSPVLPVGSILGTIRHGLAEELGLPPSLRICLGNHDQGCVTLGSGGVRPGTAVLGEGSTESMNLVCGGDCFKFSDKLIERKLCFEPYILPDTFFLPTVNLTYGNSLRWFLRELGDRAEKSKKEGENIYRFLEESRKEPTELICLPHLGGTSILEPDAQIPGAIVGLNLNTSYPEIYRALMQGLNFETRINFEILLDMGFTVREIIAAGGVARNHLFMQNKSDILNHRIRVIKNFNAGLSGLAMICAVSEGEYRDYEEAAERFVGDARDYSPKENYDDLFDAYLDARNRLKKRLW
ncbi:MAG: hypothetical protein K5985_02120 [Lachnospiraceae bacterium]|nr:hypothetical protein [Lachnospiraceae bacterium]